jgi:hypothetical protein
MVMYAIGLAGGEARICDFPDPSDLAAKMRPGEWAVPIEAFAEGRMSADGQSFVRHVPDLAELRSARRVLAKNVRHKRIGQGVMVPGVGLVQTDSGPGRDSLAAIERLAGRAMRQAGETFRLKLADNSVAEITAAQMIEVADLVGAHEQACRDACDAILAAIDAAADEAGLDAIDLTAGYPPLP